MKLESGKTPWVALGSMDWSATSVPGSHQTLRVAASPEPTVAKVGVAPASTARPGVPTKPKPPVASRHTLVAKGSFMLEPRLKTSLTLTRPACRFIQPGV
ncbi:hypothetical protein D3C72_922340 [compost metagenome]